MRFGNGLPRQCAHWLAMTGFFDSLRNTTQRVVFLYFSRSAQQNRRGSNSLPGIPRMAEPFAGALPLPLDLTRFAQVEAASSSLPAAHSKKNTPSCRMVFLYFSRSAQQNRRGSNSLPGIPRMAEPFAGALPSPLDLTRCAPVEAASSTLPAAFQKETPSCRMVFLFGAGDEARTRYLDLGKVALYQMSYARKRKIDCSTRIGVCQSRTFSFSSKSL